VSLLSQATQRSAALSLKTMQTGHFTELGLFVKKSGRPLLEFEVDDTDD
jgi:hypothetical protein